MSGDTELDTIYAGIETFVNRAREELQQRWSSWRVDLTRTEIHEVIGALLARQVTLATQLAQAPSIWNSHLAPLVLRAMADVYVTIAWILKDPDDRSRKFILYGLGQAKLQLEHHKAQIGETEPTPEQQNFIESLEAWINSQRFTFLTEVHLGSWSGISTREMAIQAGCLDFYNYVYQPFSACSHSIWHHVARYNLRQCSNPLHRYHRIPEDLEIGIDSHYFYLASKYLEKTFSTFDETFGIEIEGASAFEQFLYTTDQLSKMDTDGTDSDLTDTQPSPSTG